MRKLSHHAPGVTRPFASVLGAIAVGLTLLVPWPARAAEITVFAASSLKTVLDDIAADWSDATGNKVALAYDASPKLAKQVQQGAPADVFISAAPEWMDVLEADGLIVAETRRDIVSNRIVLVAHDPRTPQVVIGPDLDLLGLLAGGKLSMAMVSSVPAGQYGKEALEHFGLWDQVADHVVQSDNVRTALALVELGETPLGIVYYSDTFGSPDNKRTVRIVGTFPAVSHATILYPAAQIAASQKPEARAFLEYLSSDAAQAAFAAYGFVVLQDDSDG